MNSDRGGMSTRATVTKERRKGRMRNRGQMRELRRDGGLRKKRGVRNTDRGKMEK